MSYEDRVLALFAEANPVSDHATLDDLMRPTLSLIDQGEDAMSDTKPQPINIDRPIVRQERNRGLLFGVAAAVMALVLGAGLWIGLANGTTEQTLEEAAAGGDPIAVINVFYQEWSEGDVEGALGYVASSAELGVRDVLEYVVALEPAGWFWSVGDCIEQTSGIYRCRIGMNGDPVIDALAAETPTVQIKVKGSFLQGEVKFPNYSQEDRALASYAREQDLEGYTAVCTNPFHPIIQGDGVIYNQACGAFLSQYVAPMAAELTAP